MVLRAAGFSVAPVIFYCSLIKHTAFKFIVFNPFYFLLAFNLDTLTVAVSPHTTYASMFWALT